MRKIPDTLRAELDADPWMNRCAITGRTVEKIDWHHNLIHAGRQINEKFAIIPLARSIHDRAHEPAIKDLCDWIMLNRATDEQLRFYSRAVDYRRRRDVLNARFGPYLSTRPALQNRERAV